MNYFPRIADKELATLLATSGAVVIEGPKACGKTETARRNTESSVLLDVDQSAQLALVPESPELIVLPSHFQIAFFH